MSLGTFVLHFQVDFTTNSKRKNTIEKWCRRRRENFEKNVSLGKFDPLEIILFSNFEVLVILPFSKNFDHPRH